MRHVATNVQEEVVAGSGHWLIEERPEYTVALITKFIDGLPVAFTGASSAAGDANEERLTPAEYKFPQVGNPGTGSSGYRRHRDPSSERQSRPSGPIYHPATRTSTCAHCCALPSRRQGCVGYFRHVDTTRKPRKGPSISTVLLTSLVQ